MKEFLLRKLVYELKSGKTLEQLVEIDCTNLLYDTICKFGRVFSILIPE